MGDGISPRALELSKKIAEYSSGFNAVWILGIGNKMGLFKTVARHLDGIRPEDLATEMGFAPAYTAAWCQAAYAYELLDYDGAGAYRMPDELAPVLVDDECKDYLGGSGRYYVETARDLVHLPEAFRGGSSKRISDRGNGWVEGQAESSKPMYHTVLNTVLPQVDGLKEGLERGLQVLELAPGAGNMMIRMAKRFPASRFVGIDIDRNSVLVAQRNIKENELGMSVAARVGDCAHMELDGEFDLAWSFAGFHEMGDSESQLSVLRSTRRALRPSGRLIIWEIPYPERVEDSRQAIYRTTAAGLLDELLLEGRFLKRSEILGMLDQAGFAPPTIVPVRDGHYEVYCTTRD